MAAGTAKLAAQHRLIGERVPIFEERAGTGTSKRWHRFSVFEPERRAKTTSLMFIVFAVAARFWILTTELCPSAWLLSRRCEILSRHYFNFANYSGERRNRVAKLSLFRDGYFGLPFAPACLAHSYKPEG